MPSAKVCTKCGSITVGGGKCLICGANQLIPLSAPLAQKIITDTGQVDAAASAAILARKSTAFNGKILAACVGIGILLLVLLVGVVSREAESDQPAVPAGTASASSAAPTNDAEMLLSRCGNPTLDDSTEYDVPRPPFPTRVIEYNNAKLRAIFIPGDGSPGDPPPYRWKLMGITDMTAKNPANARVVSPSEAAARMPCWKPE